MQVEARIVATFPDRETMRLFGGETVLRDECARQLVSKGCAFASIEYGEAQEREPGVWTMQARGGTA